MSRFFLGILLNSIFVIIEIIYGFQANSVALLADALHNASDVLGLILVWSSYIIAKQNAPHKYTYGYKNITIFAAFLNSLVLLFAIGNLLWESFHRLAAPEPVTSSIVIIVAAIGMLVNGATALLFLKDRHTDINIKAVFLNMALDALLSLSVAIGGILMWWKGWTLVDPIMGCIIAVTIIFSFWGLFKESINLIFQAVPQSIDLHEVIHDITSTKQVFSYHDLHIWALSTTETALSVHIVTSKEHFNPEIICALARKFRDKYNIHHSTVQLEVAGNGDICTNNC